MPGPVQAEGDRARAAAHRPPVWLLGSSGFSAQLAGRLGLPFAFAHHFSSAHTLPALELYRHTFRPSEVLSEPYALIGVNALAAEDRHEAYRQVLTGALSMVRLRTGRPVAPDAGSTETLIIVCAARKTSSRPPRVQRGCSPPVMETRCRSRERSG